MKVELAIITSQGIVFVFLPATDSASTIFALFGVDILALHAHIGGLFVVWHIRGGFSSGLKSSRGF